ncbi:MAG: zinc ribbon domain-containing protein [Gemmatimonadota bacterium]
MTELERLTATVLTQWHADGGSEGGPIGVGQLLDRVLPYRQARRLLGIDISEDYEALMLRLLAEEEGLVHVAPHDAAEMARRTIGSKLPDLDILQKLRSAELTVTPATVARLQGVLQMPPSRVVEEAPAPELDVEESPLAESNIEVGDDGPIDDADIIPLPVSRVVADAIRVALEAPPAAPVSGPPPEFLTAVQFTPPSASCWSCTEALPEGRVVKFCPFCGADQRHPACPSCGEEIERQWKHCPECGTRLGL